MFWLDERDESKPAPHACGPTCARIEGVNWVCTRTGTLLGPALHAALIPSARSPGSRFAPRNHDCSPDARGRFMTAAQQLLRRLVVSDRRHDVERSRAEKARVLAMRAAYRSFLQDSQEGRLPNVGLALCSALATFERSTSAMDVRTTLQPDVEGAILRVAGDFFSAHLMNPPPPGGAVAEIRPSLEGLALATLYFMREGMPGVLPRSRFLAVSLPELARLKSYGCKVNHYTLSRRYIQSILDEAGGVHASREPTVIK